MSHLLYSCLFTSFLLCFPACLISHAKDFFFFQIDGINQLWIITQKRTIHVNSKVMLMI